MVVIHCPLYQCGVPFKNEDVTIINGTDEDVKRQREAMEERRLQAKQAKLAKVSKINILITNLVFF